MKKLSLLLAMAVCTLHVSAKTALVVIAHGAPSPQWNKPVLDLERKLNEISIKGIDYKRVALMEFSQPNIPSVVRDCEKEGVDTIFALPLFIAPSSHSEDDIPNLLGLKYDPNVREDLINEEAEFVKSNIKFIVGPTLMSSDIIEKTMCERIKEMSVNENEEGVLILAHGDPERIGYWTSLLKRTGDYVKQHTKINYIDTELIGMGQAFASDVTPLIKKAKENKKRVLVQGIYLMSSVADMAKRTGLMKDGDTNVVFSKYGILPKSENEVLDWIVATTQNWTSSF
jgi:sirohydrochlorin ferrochelatase